MNRGEYNNMYRLETSHWWYKTLHSLVEFHVKKKAGSPGPQSGTAPRRLKILDAGCGTGHMMEILEKYGDTEGIDFSVDAIGYARSRGLTGATVADLNQWKATREYDVIVCLDVLYHQGINDDRAIIREFRKAMPPGGMLVINLPAFELLRRDHDRVVHTRQRYRLRQVTKMLSEEGFIVDMGAYRLPALYVIILLSKFLINKKAHHQPSSDLGHLPGLVNKMLAIMGLVENFWLIRTGWLPFGSSLFVVSHKTSEA